MDRDEQRDADIGEPGGTTDFGAHRQLAASSRERFTAQYKAPRRRPWGLPLVLFVLSCWSTYASQQPPSIEYAVAIMAMLGAHEMGHFLQSVRYGVPASLPYFIPTGIPFLMAPVTPFGTMGAVIFQEPGVANRKQLYDIAISGPLAGLAVALPTLIWGMSQSRIIDLPPNVQVQLFGDPLLIKWVAAYFHGPMKPGQDIFISPVGFAGWVGVFITALNLIPIGQLDGGHILYTLLPRQAHFIARFVYFTAAALMVYGGLFISPNYFGFALLLLLIGRFGIRHGPTADDRVPLGVPRVILGWMTLMFLFIGFTPTPMYTYTYVPESKVSARQQREVDRPGPRPVPRQGSDTY